MALTAGSRLGPYEIVAAIGAGGMGEVYRARDTKLGREVALKILPATFRSDTDRLARFEREARSLAALNHPNIGAIYGVEEAPGITALVLELVEGETLAERLAGASGRSKDRPLHGDSGGGSQDIGRGRPSGRPVPISEALTIARQIAAALEAAHERAIVHRDLKPANIKITPAGVVKVLDFGLAKYGAGRAGGAGEDGADLSNSPTMMSSGTRAGMILGTAAYMSPEQARGRAVDKRADIWAFGCVLFETLTGQMAFRGESLSDVLVSVLEREPDWTALPAATPPAVRRLLQRCLDKDLRRRLHDIADARVEIEDTLSGATSPMAPPVAKAPTGRGRLAWSVAAVALLAMVGALAWGVRSAARVDAGPRLSRALRLTNTPAQEFGPAISPDGKWVAYLSNERGPTDIWVKFLDSGATLNLTASLSLDIQATGGIGGLDISPDGGAISFVARQNPSAPFFDTWVIPAPIGGIPRKLLTGLQAMRWSPDGKRVVAMRPGAIRGDTLLIANSDGTDQRELIPVRGGRHIHWPQWSRDGRYIHFIYTFNGFGNSEPSEIYRVPASGGTPEPVVQTSRRAIYPVPLPDDGGLLFAANPDSVDLGLWWQSNDGRQRKPLTTGVGEHVEPRLSADGRRVVCTLINMRQSLVLVPVRFGEAVQPRALTDGYSGDLDPMLDPRGARIVFSSLRSGNRNLWFVRPDGSQPTPLTAGTSLDERPAFSPDGQQVAFVSDRSGQPGIWVVSADGGAPRLVGPAVVLDKLTWSPDGRRVIYAAPGGDLPQLMSMSVADGTIERFPTPGAGHAPAWSPTGDRFAYLEPTAETQSRTWVAFLDNLGQPLYRNLPKPPQSFQNGLVSWSPDGRRLAALSRNTNTAAAVWIVEPDGREPFRKLLDLPLSVLPRGITWTADGSAVIIANQEPISDIVLFDLIR